ncbi:hypothetical protein [Actinomadura miaoliensis]|uniref:DUF4190 domain-containing protein n=1 Tax=Actinomadura miaoliensis TaxID=430685 RepID=A0ABP7VU82_9ACTN
MSEQPGQGDGGTAPRQDTGRTPGDDTAPGGPAGPPPAGRPPTNGPEDRTGWRALWLGVGALALAWPLFPLALVLGVASLVVGVKAQRRARRHNVLAPGAGPGMVLGAVGLAMAVAAAAVSVLIGPEMNGYTKCMDTANTKIDEDACRDKYIPRIEEKLNLPKGSMSGTVLP